MSTTIVTAGPDSVSIARSLALSRTVGNIIDGLGVSYNGSLLTGGTAAGQVDKDYALFSQTIAASGTLSLNLLSLTDPFGNTITFARLKRIYMDVAGASAVAFGGGATGVKSIFNAVATSQLTVNKGMAFYLGTDPGATGYAVITNFATLTIVNLDSVNIATINLVLSGCSA